MDDDDFDFAGPTGASEAFESFTSSITAAQHNNNNANGAAATSAVSTSADVMTAAGTTAPFFSEIGGGHFGLGEMGVSGGGGGGLDLSELYRSFENGGNMDGGMLNDLDGGGNGGPRTFQNILSLPTHKLPRTVLPQGIGPGSIKAALRTYIDAAKGGRGRGGRGRGGRGRGGLAEEVSALAAADGQQNNLNNNSTTADAPAATSNDNNNNHDSASNQNNNNNNSNPAVDAALPPTPTHTSSNTLGLSSAPMMNINANVPLSVSSTYSWNAHRKERVVWTDEETRRFFDALQQYGTDFTLISILFPGRPREDIQRKYKQEWKLRPRLVEEALHAKAQMPVDLEQLDEGLRLWSDHSRPAIVPLTDEDERLLRNLVHGGGGGGGEGEGGANSNNNNNAAQSSEPLDDFDFGGGSGGGGGGPSNAANPSRNNNSNNTNTNTSDSFDPFATFGGGFGDGDFEGGVDFNGGEGLGGGAHNTNNNGVAGFQYDDGNSLAVIDPSYDPLAMLNQKTKAPRAKKASTATGAAATARTKRQREEASAAAPQQSGADAGGGDGDFGFL